MSARQQLSIKKWGRTVTFLDGEAGIQFPANSLNAKLHGLTYKPRDGYNEGAVTPMSFGQPYSILGLGHVIDEDEASDRPNYFVSVEDRNGTIKAYKIDETTLTRNALPITSENLNGGDWLVSQFYTKAYLINPGAQKTVYRHVAGSSTLDAIENRDYVAPPNDPDLTITSSLPTQIKAHSASDTVSFTATDSHTAASITKTYNADGSVLLSGTDEDNGVVGSLFIQEVFTPAVNFLTANYFYWKVTADTDINYFVATTSKADLNVAGTWTPIETKCFVQGDKKEVTFVIQTKGTTLSDIRGIRYTLNYKPARSTQAPAVQPMGKISPYMAGGFYLKASANTKRLWDTTLDSGDITFGARYTDGATNVSTIIQSQITSDQAKGLKVADYAINVGGIITLSVPAPVAPFDRVEFLRLDESLSPPKWRIINTDTTAPFSVIESHQEYEVPGLVTPLDGTILETPPVFRTKGIRYAFPFKQSMIWLTSGGSENIQLSRVGDPEEIYDSEITYDQDDLTQPAQRTLADNQADQPIWGVQAGRNAFIVGEKAAYALQGDFPVSLSPSRQIPGSRGIVGPYAGCRYRHSGGQDGATYLDPEGNVWLVNSVPEFTDDTRAKPYELSSLVRHKIKQFLLTEQLGEFPSLSMSQTLMEFQEATSSLWVILGKRAAVYRQDDSGSGWEFYEYQLTTPPGSEPISLCRAYASGSGTPTTVERTGWTHLWDDPAFGAVDDENEASSGPMNYGDKTQLLRSAGIPPEVLLPTSAILDNLHIRIRHRKVGDIGVIHDWTKMTLSGAPTGSNLALLEGVSSSEDTIDYLVASGLPSVADVNAGNVGFEIGYLAEAGNPAWNIPSNYAITVTHSIPPPSTSVTTQNATATIDVTYTGPGIPPPSVDLDLNATAWVTAHVHASPVDPMHFSIYEGEGTVTDGLGHTQSGSLTATELGVGKVELFGSEVRTVSLAAGHTNFALTSIASLVNSSASAGIAMNYLVTAAPHVKTLSTVYVDSMEISYCFTVVASSPGMTSGISWQRVCFTPDSKYLTGRSSGQLDLVEYDFRNESFIGGVGRDGGYEMPPWQLTLERMTFEGRTARLCGVQLNTLVALDTFSVYDRVGNGSYVPATSMGTASSRWVRFPVSQIGI